MGGAFRCDANQCDYCPIQKLSGDKLRAAMMVESIVGIRQEEDSQHLPFGIVIDAAILTYQVNVPKRIARGAAELILRGICTSKPRWQH